MKARIKDIAELQLGYHARRAVRDDPAGTHRVLQIGDVDDNGEIDLGDLPRIAPGRRADRYLVRGGDVLFIARGSRLNAYAIDFDEPDVIASSFFYILRPRARVDATYLAWAINQPSAQAYIQTHSRGTNITMVGKDALANLDVAVPDLETQRLVAAVARLAVREQRLCRDLQRSRQELADAVCRRAVGYTHFSKTPQGASR